MGQVLRAPILILGFLMALCVSFDCAVAAEIPEEANRLENQALQLYQQGRYSEAEPLFKQALDLKEKILGPDHLDVAEVLQSLALLYLQQDRFGEAEALLKRSLEIEEKTLGPNHSDVAQLLNHLAELYRRQGRYADAELSLQRARQIEDKALGSNYLEPPNAASNKIKYWRPGLGNPCGTPNG